MGQINHHTTVTTPIHGMKFLILRVCLDEDGIISSPCDNNDNPCVAPDDFLTFNCYGSLMDLQEKNHDLKWDTIRDDILRNGVKVELNLMPDSERDACLLELVPMVK